MKNLMKAAMITAMAAMVFGVSAQPTNGGNRGPRQGQAQGERPTPEQMIDRQVDQMTKEYQLSDKQKGEVKALLEKQQKEYAANRPKDGERPSMEDRRAQMEKSQASFNAEMKKILTGEQYKQYEDKQAERRKQMEERMKNAQGQRGQRPGNNAPAAPAPQQ